MPDLNDAATRATIVGVGSGAIGATLLAWPDVLGARIGLTSRRDARAVGAVDLALAPGILFARARWRWIAARAIANVLMGAFCVSRDHEQLGHRGRNFALALLVITVADGKVALELRK